MAKHENLPVLSSSPAIPSQMGLLRRWLPSRFRRQMEDAEYQRRGIIIARGLKLEQMASQNIIATYQRDSELEADAHDFKGKLALKLSKQHALGKALLTSRLNLQELLSQSDLIEDEFDRQTFKAEIKAAFRRQNGLAKDEDK